MEYIDREKRVWPCNDDVQAFDTFRVEEMLTYPGVYPQCRKSAYQAESREPGHKAMLWTFVYIQRAWILSKKRRYLLRDVQDVVNLEQRDQTYAGRTVILKCSQQIQEPHSSLILILGTRRQRSLQGWE